MADNVYESDNTRDNEQRKFKADKDGDVAVNTCDVAAIEQLQQIATNTGGAAGGISTDHFNGTVGLTSAQVPAVAGDNILEVLVHNTSTGGQDLLISFDGGTTFKTLTPDASIIWCLNKNTTQVDVQGSSAGAAYEIVMNRQA